MWRRIVVVFLVFLFFLTAWSAYAAPSVVEDADPATGLPNVLEEPEASGWQYSIVDRLIASPLHIIAWSLEKIIQKAKFRSVEQLVFATDMEPSPAADAFTSAEWNGLIMPWYRTVLVFATSVIVIQTVLLLKSYGYVVNPVKRAGMQEVLFNTAFAVLLAFGTPYILRIVLDANLAITYFARTRLNEMGVPLVVKFNQEVSGSSILDGLVRLAMIGLTAYMNILYLVRKFILGVLLVIAPIVAWSWVSRSARQSAMLLLSELLTNGLMTASHAITYAFFLSMLHLSGSGILTTSWGKLIGFTLVIPVSAFLRRMMIGFLDWLGMHEEAVAGAAGGLAALAAVGAIMTSAVAGPIGTYMTGPGGTGSNGGAGSILSRVGMVSRMSNTATTTTQSIGNQSPGLSTSTTSLPGSDSVSPNSTASVGQPGLPMPGQSIRLQQLPLFSSDMQRVSSVGALPDIQPAGAVEQEITKTESPELRVETPEENTNQGNRWDDIKDKVKKWSPYGIGITIAATGTAMRIGGTVMRLSAGPVGHEMATMGERVANAGWKLVQNTRRRITADETRYWRNMPTAKGGETGGAKEKAEKPDKAAD